MAEVIIALDTASAGDALRLVDRLGPAAAFYKVGLELYTREGPAVVRELIARDKRVFLDLKLHDIPHTVARSAEAAGALGVHLLTVHAAGGAAMLSAAREAAPEELRVIAVTVLTSLDAAELAEAWGRPVASVPEEASRLAALTAAAGLDGIVVAASDARRIRPQVGADFLLVVPGIRPTGSARDDHRRVATPGDAVRSGADYLVVGRAVTRVENPEAALAAVLAEVDAAHTLRAR